MIASVLLVCFFIMYDITRVSIGRLDPIIHNSTVIGNENNSEKREDRRGMLKLCC